MRRVFGIHAFLRVPDGTLVSPFLNSKDNQSGLPFDLIDGFSLSAGTIEPRSRSKIHLMPLVTQVTFVRRGDLEVTMKSPEDKAPYTLQLSGDQAVLTRPGTLFQLINESEQPSEVLYIVSPAYLFEQSGGKVLYDDAVVLEENWEELASTGWKIPGNLRKPTDRRGALQRLGGRGR